MDARLAVAASLVLTPFAWALGRLRRAWKRRRRRWSKPSADADLFRVYRAEDLARSRVVGLGARLTALSSSLAARAQALSSANEVLAALALVLVVAGASRWTLADRATVVPFAVAFFLAYRPLETSATRASRGRRGRPRFERLSPADRGSSPRR